VIKRALLTLSLAASVCSAQAATIDDVISPTSFVLASAGTRNVATFDGKPVFIAG
jgi:hypothetical protein